MNPTNPGWTWLRRNWPETLRQALIRVLRSDVPIDDAAATLGRLSAQQLLQVDSMLRCHSIGYGPRILESVDDACVDRELSDESVAACLFITAGHPSGFFREHAVRALESHPGRLTMAAALIRSADWVDAVRHQAQRLVVSWGHCLETGHLLFEALDVVALIRARERVATDFWPKVIEPMLLAPENSANRWATARQGNAPARLLAYDLIARADPHEIESACRQSLDDPEPRIARWGLERCAAMVNPARIRGALEQAMRHPHASIRASAVRLLGTLGGDIEARLRDILFDLSRAPRNAAAFLLRTRFDVDPLRLWREALDCRQGPRAQVALVALSEAAQACDVARLTPWLQHTTSRLRSAALRGMARAGAPDLPVLLGHAMTDESPRMVAAAMALGATHGTIDRATLDAGFARAATRQMRSVFIDGTMRLNKWDALWLLLTWSKLVSGDEAVDVHLALRRWLQIDVRSFDRMPMQLKQSLIDALVAARPVFPDLPWGHFVLAIDHA